MDNVDEYGNDVEADDASEVEDEEEAEGRL